MLNEMRRVALTLGTVVLSGPKYMTIGRINRQSIMTRFGSWREAVALAGLRSPTIKGGLRKACPMCGNLFRGGNGKKSAKTCSEKCASDFMSAQRILSDEVTIQAARGRANRHKGDLCERCGSCAVGRALHAHHKDRNPYNNDPSNIETLCVRCHWDEHRRKPMPCAECGSVFQPKNKSSRFCSRHCAGVVSARNRLRP